jgi:CRP-like cAMP-binding protein
MNDIMEALHCCAIFKGVDEAVIHNMISTADYQVRQYDKNEFICREDQSSVSLGIVILGCVEIQKIFPSGNNVCLFDRNIGDMFGGAVVFSTKTLYPCDVFSKDKSKILFLNRKSIFEMCKNTLIAENILKSFANSVFYFEKRLELFSYSSIQKKIAFFLLNEMETTGNRMIRLPFSKKTWAEYLNVSRPSLCRELKRLSTDHIIHINKDRISILNQEKLIFLLQQ